MIIHCNSKQIDCSQPKIMGILNCTPNSFSDGGDFFHPQQALDRAYQMIEEGADIIDIGAESSNPKATPIGAEEEIKRLLPIVRQLVQHINIPISIDSYHAQTIEVMIQEGIDIINDINGLRDEKALRAVSRSNVAVVIMHLHNNINMMHQKHSHNDIIHDLILYFKERIETCAQHHILKNRIIIDPGFGFGKTEMDQITLLKTLDTLHELSLPLLVGLSRKRLIGHLTNVAEPKQRLAGNISAALWSIHKGAHIVRVHDVKETKEALLFWQTLTL